MSINEAFSGQEEHTPRSKVMHVNVEKNELTTSLSLRKKPFRDAVEGRSRKEQSSLSPMVAFVLSVFDEQRFNTPVRRGIVVLSQQPQRWCQVVVAGMNEPRFSNRAFTRSTWIFRGGSSTSRGRLLAHAGCLTEQSNPLNSQSVFL